MSSPFNNNYSTTRGRGRGRGRGSIQGNREGNISRGTYNRERDFRNLNLWGTPVGRGIIHKEGDVTNPENRSKRIFVKNYPKHTNDKDLKLFFGIDKIDSICMYEKNYSVISFKYPSQLTEALERNGDQFFDKKIIVRRYEEFLSKDKQQCNERESSPVDGYLERCRKARETTSRSRSNSESSAVSSIGHVEVEEIRREEQTNNINNMPNYDGQAQEQPSYSFNEEETDHQSISISTLPPDVEPILINVVKEKSARMLSLEQLNRVLKYFRIEKAHVSGQDPEEDMNDEAVDEETMRMIEQCTRPISDY